jgi:UDP-N-acetylglucosamine 3-dehydrogenase
MSASLRAAVIGAGAIGHHHVRVLSRIEGVELVAIVDPAGDPHGVAREVVVLPDIEVLPAYDIDLAVVAVPTAKHELIGLVLADAGIHTLIEKPLAHDVTSATRLAEAFASGGLVGAVGHIERFNPSLQELHKRLAAGELGEVYQIATRRQGPFPPRIADVGVVLDLATHDIDSTAWVSGADFVTVSARTANKSGRAYEDLVAAVCQLSDGTATSHLVNWLSPLKERVTTVTGERGCFLADTLSADLTFYANANVQSQWDAISLFRGVAEGDVTRFAIAKLEPLRAELEAFRDAVLGIRDDVVTMGEGLRTVRVARALLDSASSGQTVTIGAPVGA